MALALWGLLLHSVPPTQGAHFLLGRWQGPEGGALDAKLSRPRGQAGSAQTPLVWTLRTAWRQCLRGNATRV